ncbi:hypothetical protein LTR27_010708 [Elasticomyces elasticus]|nr:hypothetical protein LTR27_010708 [Elasticomyces elasticus]
MKITKMWSKLRVARRSQKPPKLWNAGERPESGLITIAEEVATPSSLRPVSQLTASNIDQEGTSGAVAGDNVSSHEQDFHDQPEELLKCEDQPGALDSPEQGSSPLVWSDLVRSDEPDITSTRQSVEVDQEPENIAENLDHEGDLEEECEVFETEQYDGVNDDRVSDEEDEEHDPDIEDVDEEAARAMKYIRFDQEDADDYTAGPARLVSASDGVKDCAALLMTTDLSSKVQRAAKFRFERELDDALTRHEDRIAELRKIDTEAAAAELVALEGEAEKLQLLLTETQAAQMSLKAGLNTQADNLRRIQTELSRCLEEAFIHANLMEPAVEQIIQEVPELQVEEEYQKLCKAIREDQGMEPTSVPASLHSCNEHLKPISKSPEDQHRQALVDSFYAAQSQLKIAQQNFDFKDEDRGIELAAHQQGAEPLDESQEAFDLRWYGVFQDITHELVKAEEDFAAAKAAALEIGLEMDNDDAESGFADGGSMGYDMEFETLMVASTSRPRIDGWLDAVPDQASPEVEVQADVDVDDWGAQVVDMGDSFSCVAYEPAWRRRIKKWRQSCGW